MCLHLDFRTDALKKINESSTGCSFLILAVNIAELGNASYFHVLYQATASVPIVDLRV